MNWRKAVVTLAIGGAMLGVPAGASAALLGTYTPSPSDMNDLDHHMLYAWRLTDTTLGSKTITSATLTFNKMFNWDNSTNKLFIWLLDNAKNSGNGVATAGQACNVSGTVTNCLTQFTDDPTSTVTNLVDDFNLASSVSKAGWLVDAADMGPGAGGDGDKLTEKSFGGPGVAPPANGGGWTSTANGTQWYNGNSINVWNYTYTFSTSDLASLNAFLSPGDNTFALGLDPDCHYYNTGITLQLWGDNTITSVPEPSTWLLIGTGMAFLARRRVMRKTAR